jgi:hypothetical protein
MFVGYSVFVSLSFYRTRVAGSQPADTVDHSTGLKPQNPPLRHRGHVTSYVHTLNAFK